MAAAEKRSQIMKIANLKCAAFALLIMLTTGCATGPGHAEGGMKEYQPVEPAFDRGFKAKRMVTYGAHAAWVYARAVYENPINRPVSHVTSLASWAVKSSGGLLRRVALGTVQMPALNGEIPEISHAMPMDLAAFEKKLDTITGTSQDTGRIKFLVDGDEYFCRLSEMIQNAEESVDIRTYIFDNDDYAVTLADRLKARSADIRVRVMLDGIGNMQAMRADPDTMPTSHKVPLSMRMYLERDSSVKVRNMTNPWLTGDHTKTTIIDKKIAFVGGM